MLGREQTQRWQVNDLAGLDPDDRRVGQRRAAPAAPLRMCQATASGSATCAR
jgi:hypothetical protein